MIHLNPSESDHLPILLEVREVRRRHKKRGRGFTFDDRWAQDEECRELVAKNWEGGIGSNSFLRVCDKIRKTRGALEKWSSSKFGSLRGEIEETRSKLASFYEVGNSQTTELRLHLEGQLSSLLQQEMTFWKQRAKMFWLKDGDANTNFFHQSASDRKRSNMISGLFDEERRWCQTDQDLERVVVQYFEGLFKSSEPRNFDPVMETIQCVISDEINAGLTREIEGEEISSALKQK